MRGTLKRSLQFVFRHEGGWGNDPHDRGNWTGGKIGVGENKGTKYGIAAHVYPTLDIKSLTLDDATQIYARDYAPKVAFDLQPVGVDHTQLDIAINAGPARANALQAKALGIGSASASELARRAAALPDKVPHIQRVNALMLSFYQSLATFGRYGKGWTRRNAEREAISVKWALESLKSSDGVRHDLDTEKKRADTASKTNSGAAGGAAAGGGAGSTQIDPSQFDWSHWIGAGIVGAIILGAVIYFAFNAYKHRQRANAYKAVAEL